MKTLGKLIVIIAVIVVGVMLTGNIKKDEAVVNNNSLIEEAGIMLLAEQTSSDYEVEMLKTQAVLVRTALYKEIQETQEVKTGEKIELNPIWRKKLEQAWRETEGQVLLYNEELALLPFHQVSNGKTRSGEEVLGTEEYPYLRILECPVDVEAEQQLCSVFIPKTEIYIETWDSAGYVMNVKIGEEQMSGEAFRAEYGLASSCFEVQSFENQTRIITKGVGHGLGLSQFAANRMAKEGKDYKEILQFFFEGTELKEVAEILWNME